MSDVEFRRFDGEGEIEEVVPQRNNFNKNDTTFSYKIKIKNLKMIWKARKEAHQTQKPF